MCFLLVIVCLLHVSSLLSLVSENKHYWTFSCLLGCQNISIEVVNIVRLTPAWDSQLSYGHLSCHYDSANLTANLSYSHWLTWSLIWSLLNQ
jgi:hypothetical protein